MGFPKRCHCQSKSGFGKFCLFVLSGSDWLRSELEKCDTRVLINRHHSGPSWTEGINEEKKTKNNLFLIIFSSATSIHYGWELPNLNRKMNLGSWKRKHECRWTCQVHAWRVIFVNNSVEELSSLFSLVINLLWECHNSWCCWLPRLHTMWWCDVWLSLTSYNVSTLNRCN